MIDLISVVVPVYNVEKYIEKCIKSIENQTYKNLEIILVDDGSSDSCRDRCERHAKKDARIKVIHKLNGGLSDARNVGIEIALGEYITFIDSDDYIEPTYIEYLHDLIKKNEAELAICDFKYITEAGKILNSTCDKEVIKLMNRKEAIYELLRMKMYSNSAWGKLYKKSDFEEIRYPVGKFYEDIPTTYKLFMKADTIVFGGKALYCYLYRDTAISKQKSNKSRMDAMQFVEKMVSDIISYYPEMRSVANCRMISTYIGVLYTIDYNKDKKKFNEICNKIIRIRKSVLFSVDCPPKRRVMALSAYLPKVIFGKVLKYLQ